MCARFARKSPIRICVCVLLTSIVAAIPLLAQNAGLSGVVTDPSGAVIPGASVEAVNTATQLRRLTSTDDQGRYSIYSIPDGTYQVTTRARGFSANISEDVAIADGRLRTIDVRLAVQSIATEVNVQATIVNITDMDISIGPLAGRSMIDLPYSITLIPSELIQNQQAVNLRELVKYMPSVQIQERGGSDVGRPQTRGFQGDVIANTRFDGMNMVATTAHPMEMFDRLEVLNGLSGSMTGLTPPAGAFNFIVKRATDIPTRRVMLKYDNLNSPVVMADLGQKLGKDKQFGIRFVGLYGDGKGYIDGSNLQRDLASVAFDWRFLKNTVAEINFSYYTYDKKGYSSSFAYGSIVDGVAVGLPKAPDSSIPGYGQKWAGHELKTRTESFRIRHDFNNNWHLTVGMLNQQAERGMFTTGNQLRDNEGHYTNTSINVSAPGRWDATSNIAYINGKFYTGSVLHEIAAGTNGHQLRGIGGAPVERTIPLPGTSSLDDPIIHDKPDLSYSGKVYKTSASQQQTLMFNDTITFNKNWSSIISVGQGWLRSYAFTQDGEKTRRYADNGVSLGASLLFKPIDNVTLYYTYADSLEAGAVAPQVSSQNPNIANPGEALPPYRSRQHEVGFKTQLSSRASFTVAGFRIERPFAFLDPMDNYFKEIGNQRNFGLEITATGDVFDDLTIYGGVTLLDPKLVETVDPNTSDKLLAGTPNVRSNLFVEYRLPQIRGLSFSTNWQHTGKRAADNTNTFWADGYHTVDLGARFTTKLEERFPITWRFSVDNVGNTFYWSSIFPGSVDGAGGATAMSGSAFLGSTRTYMASIEIGF